MPTPCFIVWMFSIAMIVFHAGVVFSETYPTKPIRMVTGEAGAGVDLVARLIAPGISGALGQQVIVDNRGGSVIIPAQIVAQASPDGYTLLLSGSYIWTLPLMQSVPYDVMRDFSTITLAIRSPNILVVHPSVAASSVKELIALAKARPGDLNYSSGGTGASNHLAAELFKAMAGVNIVHIPYKGAAPALNALIGGQVQLMFPNAASVAPHLKSDRLRALAVTSAQPSALAPGLPTLTGSGLPGYESSAIQGIFAPAKTPEAIINRLNQEIVRVLNRVEVKERLFKAGAETVGSSPTEFAAVVKSEMVGMGKVIKAARIRAE